VLCRFSDAVPENFSAGDIITKKRNRLLEESSSTLLLLKHWLKQTEVKPWEKCGYDDPDDIQVAARVGGTAGEGAGSSSDHDVPEGADSAAEAALNSSSGLSDVSD
jgi:hypothetical protein